MIDCIEDTTPAVFLFENVTTVAERSKDDKGNIVEPAVEVTDG